ncbi:hypothetical protein K8R03_04295, partial [Candidatus Kaiserbacteria bacterium]|nr:hypothetical protein [Candidatus Kaiserbacteria bacterium]
MKFFTMLSCTVVYKEGASYEPSRTTIHMNQLNLFTEPTEKGTEEWNLGHAIREDSTGMFRVAAPKKQEMPLFMTTIRARRPRPLYLRSA